MLLTGVITLAVFLLLGRALRPIGHILEGLADIESGHYRKRLPDFDLPEFSRISSSFNTMAENLDRSQKENHLLNEKMLNVQENERRYLARELHDEMGQSLSAMKVLAASSRAFESSEPVRENLNTISSICDDLFKVVRNMMQQLRPQVLDDLGLIPALEELEKKWQVQDGSIVSLHIDPSVTDVSLRNDIHLFRIVQESVTNGVKHSGASKISVNLSEITTDSGESIEVTIVDNGTGFDPDEVRDGTGLNSIRERATSLGAELYIQSRLGVGTIVKVVLPGVDSCETGANNIIAS
ncbi:MAG: Putative methanol utilization control sensor protein moxY [uncultured Thiotrichaceae bacterium]|uniref:histidine kinase n=1 Tax=uncultured Thiotrichaceae bacterium TaxID=298394 RepID=A0A6S6U6J6_9GAMM|nr:MAG: Putative methanol utilization control sensor protein moxY [uncultured Thiotrichaceae bacterium]